MKWTKKKFIEEFNEDPEDLFGSDWENYIEEYVEEQNQQAFSDKFGKE